MKELSHAKFKYIESELYEYPYTLQAIADLREDIISGVTEGERVSVQSGISNPTAARATRLTTDERLQHLERVQKAIEKVFSRLDPDKQKLVRLKYWDKHLSDMGVYSALCVSRETYYRWRKQIVIAIAQELGLAKVR